MDLASLIGSTRPVIGIERGGSKKILKGAKRVMGSIFFIGRISDLAKPAPLTFLVEWSVFRINIHQSVSHSE